MILRIGNKALTLIEVLLSVFILTIGSFAIIRGYITSLNAQQLSQSYMDQVYLAQQKMDEIEQTALENKGLLPALSQGVFEKPNEHLTWNFQTVPFNDKGLLTLKLTIADQLLARDVTLMTYVDQKK